MDSHGLLRVDHPVAIGAHESQILQLRRAVLDKRCQGLGVMRLDKSVASLSISHFIIEIAHLADERSLLAEGLRFPLLNELTVPFANPVQSSENAPLGGFHPLVVD